jgi:hypothetical protein
MNNLNEKLYVEYDLEKKEYWLYYIHDGEGVKRQLTKRPDKEIEEYKNKGETLKSIFYKLAC